jgi:hypothetical protein
VCTPRPGRHPQSGAAIAIPARTRALFKAGTKLRSAVEYTVDPEVFLGAGIAAKTELEGALARLFGARPETFHLEQATDRIRRALGPGPQLEAEDFFAALCQDLALVDLCPEDVGLAGERNPGAPTLDPTGTLEH